MTKDDIIKLAHKAGFLIDTHAQQYQPNCILSTYGLIDENLQRFAALVVAAEREACAKVCDEMEEKAEEHGTECCKWPTPNDCAYAVRAGGNT